MEWTVRPFSEADFSAVWALERVRDPGGYASAVVVRQAAALWPGTVLVAEEGEGVAVGFTIAAVSSDPAVGWILRLKVHEELRRRGCATALLRAVLDRLRAEGVRTVRLTVAPENLAARALYAGLGFLEEAMMPDYFGPGEDRLVLALRL